MDTRTLSPLSLSPSLRRCLSRSKAPEAKSAPRRLTLIDERDRRYARVTGHGAAMSRLDGVDAERSARYQSPQNGVVATSLRSTLQRSSYVFDPPARWANRRSVPRGSSPMRMQPGAQMQMYAGYTGSTSRASVHASFLCARLPGSNSTRLRDKFLAVRGYKVLRHVLFHRIDFDNSADPGTVRRTMTDF